MKQADISHTLTVSGADFATNAAHATSADSATNAASAITAESADSATDALHATSADSATSATNATNASNAANADELGGKSPSAYALAGAEEPHAATLNDGTLTHPHDLCWWTNYGNGFSNAAYFRDAAGVVHLLGTVVAHDGVAACGSQGFASEYMITTLPPGYRPQNQEAFAIVSNNKPGRLTVNPNGWVRMEKDFPVWADAKFWLTLGGISFRCAPSGQDGCP